MWSWGKKKTNQNMGVDQAARQRPDWPIIMPGVHKTDAVLSPGDSWTTEPNVDPHLVLCEGCGVCVNHLTICVWSTVFPSSCFLHGWSVYMRMSVHVCLAWHTVTSDQSPLAFPVLWFYWGILLHRSSWPGVYCLVSGCVKQFLFMHVCLIVSLSPICIQFFVLSCLWN